MRGLWSGAAPVAGSGRSRPADAASADPARVPPLSARADSGGTAGSCILCPQVPSPRRAYAGLRSSLGLGSCEETRVGPWTGAILIRSARL
jgi:hypothetical protein